MDRVKGKVALITGGASGLGRQAARRLAEEGACVVVTDLNEVGGAAVAEELGDSGLFCCARCHQGDGLGTSGSSVAGQIWTS